MRLVVLLLMIKIPTVLFVLCASKNLYDESMIGITRQNNVHDKRNSCSLFVIFYLSLARRVRVLATVLAGYNNELFGNHLASSRQFQESLVERGFSLR